MLMVPLSGICWLSDSFNSWRRILSLQTFRWRKQHDCWQPARLSGRGERCFENQTKEECRWDVVALGEVMLRFDPGDRRIWTTRRSSGEGGGEYNVARGLKRCFGMDTRS